MSGGSLTTEQVSAWERDGFLAIPDARRVFDLVQRQIARSARGRATADPTGAD